MKWFALTGVIGFACACNVASMNDGGIGDGGGSTDAGVLSDGGAALCEKLCTRGVAAGCPIFDPHDCQVSCLDSIATIEPACTGTVAGLLECVADAADICAAISRGGPCAALESEADDCHHANRDGGTQSDGSVIEEDGGYVTDTGGVVEVDAGPGGACAGKQRGDSCETGGLFGFCNELAPGDALECYSACTNIGDECMDGVCYFGGIQDQFICAPEGSKAAGEACATLNDCRAGGQCLERSGGWLTCYTICTDTCAAGDCTDTELGFKVCVISN